MTTPKPALIRDRELAWEPYEGRRDSFLIKRHVTAVQHGSPFGLGVCELEPGQSTVWWSFIEGDSGGEVRMNLGHRAHEAYYVLDGRFTFHRQDQSGCEATDEAGPGDVFYFAPGWRYRVENTGDTTGRFLWVLVPPAK